MPQTTVTTGTRRRSKEREFYEGEREAEDAGDHEYGGAPSHHCLPPLRDSRPSRRVDGENNHRSTDDGPFEEVVFVRRDGGDREHDGDNGPDERKGMGSALIDP